MVALRRELGDLGRALPVHQGRGGCRRAARISRLGAGRPGRRAPRASGPAAGAAPGPSGGRLGPPLALPAPGGSPTPPILVGPRLPDLAPLGRVGASLTLSTVALPPAVFVSPPHAIPASALWAIAVLGVVCTAAGLVVFFQLISEAGPSRASVITYINPVVAVLLGVVVLDEHMGAMSLTGLALILGGSWLSTGGQVPFHSTNGK